MLDLYRFNDADLEDVKLEDATKYATIDEGEWIHPLGNAAGTWDIFAGATPATNDTTRIASMIFMEKGRTDAKAVGKMTVVRGPYVRGRTDIFIASEAATMLPGKELTLKKDTDGKVKLGLAASGDVVKAIVWMAPNRDVAGKLHFQLV